MAFLVVLEVVYKNQMFSDALIHIMPLKNYDNKAGLIVMSRTVKISLMFILRFGRPHLNTSHMIHVICAMI